MGEITCDGKKKMYEYMSEFKRIHIVELPNCQSEAGLELYRKELIRFKEKCEELFEVTITEEQIKEAIVLRNKERIELKNL